MSDDDLRRGAAPPAERYAEAFLKDGTYRDDGGMLMNEGGVSGSVQLDVLGATTSEGRVAGSFDLTFPGGPVQGRFDAAYCERGW